jgi:hypothetical protein
MQKFHEIDPMAAALATRGAGDQLDLERPGQLRGSDIS